VARNAKSKCRRCQTQMSDKITCTCHGVGLAWRDIPSDCKTPEALSMFYFGIFHELISQACLRICASIAISVFHFYSPVLPALQSGAPLLRLLLNPFPLKLLLRLTRLFNSVSLNCRSICESPPPYNRPSRRCSP
jgi:hypothetical protein